MNVSMQENVVTRHIMGENPSAESPWQRGTFSEKQYFYPDKRQWVLGILPLPFAERMAPQAKEGEMLSTE